MNTADKNILILLLSLFHLKILDNTIQSKSTESGMLAHGRRMTISIINILAISIQDMKRI